jgi:hypothetical protein
MEVGSFESGCEVDVALFAGIVYVRDIALVETGCGVMILCAEHAGGPVRSEIYMRVPCLEISWSDSDSDSSLLNVSLFGSMKSAGDGQQ